MTSIQLFTVLQLLTEVRRRRTRIDQISGLKLFHGSLELLFITFFWLGFFIYLNFFISIYFLLYNYSIFYTF
ncbi:hypothetical protein Hanom_Chr07g00598921 [Helianthus anomalus]